MFSTVVFADLLSTTSFGVADGVGVVLMGIGVGCLSWPAARLRTGTGCRTIVAGPDLIPIITGQEGGRAIQESLRRDPAGSDKVVPTTLVVTDARLPRPQPQPRAALSADLLPALPLLARRW